MKPFRTCELRLFGCTVVATTKDHIIPKSRGGSNDPSNLRPACAPCNKRKGGRLDSEFTPFDFSLLDIRRVALTVVSPTCSRGVAGCGMADATGGTPYCSPSCLSLAAVAL